MNRRDATGRDPGLGDGEVLSAKNRPWLDFWEREFEDMGKQGKTYTPPVGRGLIDWAAWPRNLYRLIFFPSSQASPTKAIVAHPESSIPSHIQLSINELESAPGEKKQPLNIPERGLPTPRGMVFESK